MNRPPSCLAGSSFSSIRDACGRSVVRVHEQLAVAICSVEQGRDLVQWRVKDAHVITGAHMYGADTQRQTSEDDNFHPLGLKIIHGFCEDLWHSHAYKEGKTIVVCAGTHPRDITDTALLVGSFMILSMDLDVDDVVDAFEPVSHRFITYSDQLTVSDCWKALHYAFTQCGWLNLETRNFLGSRRAIVTGSDALDMREYVHYDCPLNGGFHAVVPDKLFVFDCPADLPDGAPWADAGGERLFGAAYYAEVFGDFDVDVVVRCCDAATEGDYDAYAFVLSGIEVRVKLII